MSHDEDDKAHNHSHHAHDHGNPSELRKINRQRLLLVGLITGGFMIAEAVVAMFSGSLAILADAGHMLGDVAGIAMAYIANVFATKSATTKKTYGYFRTEILAATFNALCMLGMSAFILYEAYRRFSTNAEIPALPMIVIGFLGGIVNLISMRLLSSGARNSLNTRAAYIEVLSDMLASFAVVVAGLVIQFTRWYAIDSIVSMLIAIGLIPRTWSLLMQCVHVLMEGTPDHIAIADLRTAMLSVTGVQDVHDLHVWTITSGLDAISAHVLIDQDTNSQEVLGKIEVICEQFKLSHSTIQIEIVQCNNIPCL